MAAWWTRESVAAWAQQHLPEEFTRRDVGIACRVNGKHWSEHLGIVQALQRHGLVETSKVGWGRRQVDVFRLRSIAAIDQERERDAAEARALMRIDGPVEDHRVDELRQAFTGE